jgi:hypothetical protein
MRVLLVAMEAHEWNGPGKPLFTCVDVDRLDGKGEEKGRQKRTAAPNALCTQAYIRAIAGEKLSAW